MKDESDKLTVLVLSDRDTGLCLALSYLVTEMCRFIVHCVHTEVGWRCDGEPSTLALLEAVKRACAGFESCVACRTFSNRRPSGQWSRSHIEEATGCKGPIFGCMHPVYAWALVHSAWLHNHFSVKRAMTSRSSLLWKGCHVWRNGA